MPAKEFQRTWWDFLSLSSAQLALMPLALLSASITSRLLGPQGYGILALAFSIAQVAFVCAINWASNAMVRFGRAEIIVEGSMRRTFWACTLLIAGCCIIALASLALLRGLVARYIGIPERALWIVLAMILAIVLSNQTLLLLQAHGRMRRYAMTSASERIIYIILLLASALLWPSMDAVAIFLLTVLCKLLQTLLGVSGLPLRGLFPVTLHRPTLERILRYSWPMVFAFSGGYVVDWIDLYVIRAYLPLSDVGTYQVAYQGMLSLSGLLMVLSTLAFPIITGLRVQDRQEAVRRYVTRFTPQVTVTWGLILALVSGFSPAVIPLLFGQQFIGAIRPFKILLMGIAFQSISVMYSPILASYDLTKQSTGIVIFMGLVNLAGDLVLVPRLGIAGAAVATAFSYVLSSTLYLVVGNRRLDIASPMPLLCPLPGLLALGGNLLTDSVSVGILLFLGTASLTVSFARRARLFERTDADVLEQIEMPAAFKRGIRRAMLVLSR